jgi:hypothetical protein
MPSTVIVAPSAEARAAEIEIGGGVPAATGVSVGVALGLGVVVGLGEAVSLRLAEGWSVA